MYFVVKKCLPGVSKTLNKNHVEKQILECMSKIIFHNAMFTGLG